MDINWMIEKRRKKLGFEKPGRKDVSKKKYYWTVGVIVLAAVLVTGYFAFYKGKNVNLLNQPVLEDCKQILEKYQEEKLVIVICAKNDGSLILVWENLPEGTKNIKLYRTDGDGGERRLWKIIPVSSETGGADIEEIYAEGYLYSLEGDNEEGEIIWKTTGNLKNGETEIIFSGSQSSTIPIQTGGDNNQGETPVYNNPISNPPPSNPYLPETDNQIPETPPQDDNAPTSGIIYYTPQGEISGTGTEQTEVFWVTHVNKKIEIGWQNLPTGTTKVIIYRSLREDGGYAQLFQILTGSSYFIRLDDEAINKDHYYEMKAFSGGTVLGTFGPIFLEGLN